MKITYAGIAKLSELKQNSVQASKRVAKRYEYLDYFRDGIDRSRSDFNFTDREWGLIYELKSEGYLV